MDSRDNLNYWLRRKPFATRRRFLAGTGVGAGSVAALALVGCGDDDADPTSVPTQSGGATQVGNTPVGGTPKAGGTWVSHVTADPVTIDPYRTQSFQTKQAAVHVYSRLVMMDSGPSVTPGPDVVTMDLADGYEVTDDGLQYTFTLKDGPAFTDPIGRAVTAEDVVYSFERFTGKRELPEATGNRMTMVESVTATDEKTVVFKLKVPHGPFLNVLADAAGLQILPQETGDAFDPALKMIGSGPWLFDSYEVGSRIKYRRNPDWHFGPGRPYMDTEIVIIPEYASALNQFLAGELDEFLVNPTDLERVNNELDDVQWRVQTLPGLTHLMFQLTETDKPWADHRVRQAISAAIDRDAILDVAFNLDRLIDQGYDLEYKWNNFVPHAWGDFWLDPQGDDISAESASFFKYDPTMAKQLLSAAGHADGFTVDLHTVTQRYGAAFDDAQELIQQWCSQIGIQLNFVVEDYASQFIPQTYEGNYSGMAHAPNAGLPEPGDWPVRMFHSSSKVNSSKVKDSALDAKIDAIQSELNSDDRKRLMRELQDDLARTMYYVPTPLVGGPRFTAYQPWARNAIEHWVVAGTGQPTEEKAHYWVDKA